MSENLQNLLRESLLNNSYDYDSMHGVLHMAWENSYSYLYDLQKNYVEFEDLEYISNDTDKDVRRIGRLYVDKMLNARFDVEYDFIHVCDREEFRNSKFYFRNFTFYDMVNHPDIFTKLPIIIVDNQTIWDYKLHVDKNTISVILPFRYSFVIDSKRNPDTDELIYLDHNIRVLVVDNVYYNEFTSIGTISDLNDYNHNTSDVFHTFGGGSETITINGEVVASSRTLRNLTVDITDIMNNNIDDDGLFIATINKDVQNKKNLKEFYSSNILISNNVSYDSHANTYNCSFQIGEKLSRELESHDTKYIIHILFVDKLYNYKIAKSRHDPKSEFYYLLDVARVSEIYSGIHDANADNTFGRDILCDENGECNVFMLQCDVDTPYAMPIPVEDLIVQKLDEDNDITLLKSKETVKLYYPNIYRIVDPDRKPGDRYRVSYFYHKASSLQYTPMHNYFYRFMQIRYNERPIEEIVDFIYRGVADFSSFTEEQLIDFKNTFKKIMEYQYYNYNYGEVDFVKRYTLEPTNSDKNEVEYKDETLKSWINVDPFILRDYVIEQDKLYTPIYHLWTYKMNLSARLRTNTTQEMGKFGYDLGREYFVFSFRNEETVKNNILDARIFVDGIHIDDIVQERYKFTDYFYIPIEYFEKFDGYYDNYIEIEIFPTYKYGTRIQFDSIDDVKTITLLEPADQIFPTAQDLFYMEPSGHLINDKYNTRLSSTDAMGNKDTVEFTTKQTITIGTDKVYPNETTIYSNELFEITAKYKDGDFVVKTVDPDKPVKFTRLSTFEIKPIRNYVVNKDLYVGISKVPNYITYTIDRDGYPYIALNENNFKFNIEYLRIFRNGRLLPRQKYCFFSSFVFPRIQFTDYMNIGDVIHIDITPYRYKEIYYQDRLEQGKTLIDLKDVITKPFDIRYYDVYMNGRKLGLNSVWTISPWEITLTNLMSLSNLQIFEKERDWEYFGTNYKTQKYYYTIDDLFDSSFITEGEKNQIIKEMIDEAKEPRCNIRPPQDLEPPIDFTDDRKYPHVSEFYFNELIPKTFVDPDTKQFDDIIMKEEYTTIDDVYRVHPVDSYRTENEKERRKNYVDALALNPDDYIEGANEEHLTYVYCVGHPEDVEDDMLSEIPDNYYKEEEIDNAD